VGRWIDKIDRYRMTPIYALAILATKRNNTPKLLAEIEKQVQIERERER